MDYYDRRIKKGGGKGTFDAIDGTDVRKSVKDIDAPNIKKQ